MIRRYLSLFFAVCMAFSLYACQQTNSGTPTSATEPTDSNDPTTPIEPGIEKKLHILDYQSNSYCVDGVMLVKDSLGKIGMINEAGKLLVDYKYNSGIISDGGYAVFEGTYVYDKTGTLIYEDKGVNTSIEHCGNGIMCITETGEWIIEDCEECRPWEYRRTYRKLDGTEIISVYGCESDLFGAFNKQGYAWFERNAHNCCPWAFVEIINQQGEVLRSSSDEHYAVANNAWILDEDGYIMVDHYVISSDGCYISIGTEKGVYCGDWHNWIDDDEGKFSLKCAYNNSGSRCCSLNSLSVLHINDSYLLFDIEQGKVTAKYSNIVVSESRYILVENSNGNWGYIDRSGTEYEFYEDATSFDDGYAMVKINEMLYIIDENFNIISEGIEGDSAAALFNKFFQVKKGNDTFIVKYNP